MILIIGMTSALYQIFKHASPHPKIQILKFQQEQWIIQLHDGQQCIYEKFHICVDTGLFVLLHFSTKKRSRFVVVFYDQLSQTALRTIRILQTIL
ncbi:MAG: hypothetical protein CK424_01080 [Legionella sp.]|nr:MAG: hypothetical protein CK424_01080 [Legionella sp.]